MPYSPPIFEKQARIVNSSKRFVLVSGPRKTGKTIGCAHAMAHHCAVTPNAFATLIGPSATVNADGGSWQDLTGEGGVIDRWVGDGVLEWVDRPRLRHTKKFSCKVRGPAGNATIFLDSLHVEDEVEDLFKNRRFSMIWVTQMDQTFRKRKSFTAVEQCLRMVNLPMKAHRFVADTNPPDNGKDAWFYDLWYEFPHRAIPEELPEMERRALAERKDELELIEIFLEDNIFITDAERRAVYANHCDDPALLARYYYGRYEKASGTGYFCDVWKPLMHVKGAYTVKEEDEEHLVPQENCWELLTGWDLGARNPAFTILEAQNISTDPHVPLYAYRIIDEIVILKEDVRLEDFVELVMQKMDKWERFLGRKVFWTHCSDSASFDKYDSIADTYEHKHVFEVSDGRIELTRVPKGRDSVINQLKLLRKLMFQNRIHVDIGCEMVLHSFRNFELLKTGRVNFRDPLKHALDAVRYPIAWKSFGELQERLIARTASAGSSVVSVGY